MNTRHKFAVLIAVALWVSGMGALGWRARASQSLAPAPQPASQTQPDDATCKAILRLAYQTLQDSCVLVARNQACYGNTQVQATPATDQPIQFEKSGDKVGLRAIKRLITSPLDTAANTWGLSLLKVQADLPDSLPGQNVIFLVYGNTSLENRSGDMRAFYFTTGLGQTQCFDAPQDGILVRSPKNMRVSFNANGVDIKISSTVKLSAIPNQKLRVHLLEGAAEVSAAGKTQIVAPGQGVEVPLGGASGVESVGQPSDPAYWHMDSPLLEVFHESEAYTGTAITTPLRVNGCVESIAARVAIIRGYPVYIGANTDPATALAVGQCYQFEGTLRRIGGELVIVRDGVTVLEDDEDEKEDDTDKDDKGDNQSKGANPTAVPSGSATPGNPTSPSLAPTPTLAPDDLDDDDDNDDDDQATEKK
jgi:hypothetical protein